MSFGVRTVSDHALDLEAHRGWYLDLAYDGENAAERVIGPAVFPTGSGANRIRFATLIPTTSECGGSRDGYLMDLDLFSGARTSLPIFDLTNDGDFDEHDLVNGTVASGIDFGTGEAPATLRIGQGVVEALFTGRGERVRGRGGQAQEGRQSWRQIR
jgi:type IV pilus assembly protein PilY1